MTALTAYLVRGLQLLLGTSKRSLLERAEELGNRDEDIPLTQSRHNSEAETVTLSEAASAFNFSTSTPVEELQAPLRAQDPAQVTGTGGPPTADPMPSASDATASLLRQNPPALTRAQMWAAFVNANLDIISYSAMFILIGLPIYYAADYAMPAQLCLNVLAYFAALSLPPLWRRYLHPAVVASAITIIGIWVLALTRRNSLDDGLHAYQTNTKYAQLLRGRGDLPDPGAGDIFSSVLDVSIVALALPMFQYRHELRRAVGHQC